jgi:hypothetical protein
MYDSIVVGLSDLLLKIIAQDGWHCDGRVLPFSSYKSRTSAVHFSSLISDFAFM